MKKHYSALNLAHPLESFILTYLDIHNIPWEQVESQVYDVLLPDTLKTLITNETKNDLARVCFDPEALHEHPHSRFLAPGDPSLDAFFQEIVDMGRATHIFLAESNLAPKHLETAIRTAVTFPKDCHLAFGVPRPLYFRKGLFCFQITHLSDEKQQQLLSIGVDLHFGRIVRHLETLLNSAELFSSRPLPYPNASTISCEESYQIAWKECYGKAKIQTGSLQQQQHLCLSKELDRLRVYFNELRQELLHRRDKAISRPEEVARFSSQLEAMDLEEKVRTADLQKKSILHTDIRLMNVLWIEQLHIIVPLVCSHRGQAMSFDIVWDPKSDKIEPLICPTCVTPTLHLILERDQMRCPLCKKTPSIAQLNARGEKRSSRPIR